MKEEIKTKFWGFNQNNSGGYFVEDEENGVCEYVIIEAKTPTEAWDRLKKVADNVDGFFDYCGCCGERWSNWLDEEDGKDYPMIDGTTLEVAEKSIFRNRAFVHYYDGYIKEFKFK